MPVPQDPAPLFSIITVCFNALEALQRTMAAFECQTFRDFEHIVVDGASPDGSAEWLSRQSNPRLRWLSEPDRGLYDAMNKGLAMARGHYVWFVNAGDLPEGPEVLSRLADCTAEDPDVLYGEVLLVQPDGRVLGTRSQVTAQRLPEDLTWKDMRFGMVVSHQGFLPRRAIAPPYLPDNLCADIDWVIRCLKVAQSVVHTHLVLARFETDGLSRQRHRQSLGDRYRVLSRHFGPIPNLLAHGWILLRAFGRRMLVPSKARY
jgi:glycosyltransferase involved in cell wall biosynthesis